MAYVQHYEGPRTQTLTTPRDFFDRLHERFSFTLDGAASPGNALLPRYSSEDQPRCWLGERVFCNPPWSAIPQFVELAPMSALAVLLVPARVNSRWFHRAMDLGGVPQFFPKRLVFGGKRGVDIKSNSPVDCLLLVFGS